MQTRSKLISVIILTSVLFVSTPAQQRRAMPKISEPTLRAHIKFLSDDMLEGRGTGARGGELAAKYIAAQLQALGLRGAASGGSFFQPVSLVGVKADQNTNMSFTKGGTTQILSFGDDFVAVTGAQTERVKIDADLVFVGYGIEAPDQRWNDYKGQPDDYRGKVLVMLVNDPPATAEEPALFGSKALTYYGRWTYKYEEAARRGAVGAILLHTDESAGYPWSVVRTSNGSWRFDIARTEGDKTPYLQLRSWVTNDAANKLMTQAGQDLDSLRTRAASRDFQPVPLGVKVRLDLRSEVNTVSAPNVAGILQGSDLQLRDQYVVYTAHWDHLGIGIPNRAGDAIYNGAQDNATGVAAVIAIAEALAKLPPAQRPRRSSLFLFTTAEEQGLLGAEWYVNQPLVPLNKTAAIVNLDSLNVLGPTNDFIPLGADRSTLKAVVEAVAREKRLRISPDARPEQGSFFRSDHFPFAKAGVPAVSMRSGTDYVGRPQGWGEEQFRAYNTAHYHQPSDEVRDTWDFRGLVQVGEIALAIGRKIGDMPTMPKYNPDDEFARKN